MQKHSKIILVSVKEDVRKWKFSHTTSWNIH